MFKFILIFIPYIGQGDFVCDLIKTITENNDRLLLGLFNIKQIDLDNEKLIQYNTNYSLEENNDLNFITEVINCLNKYKSYTKPEILDLIGSFCKSNN